MNKVLISGVTGFVGVNLNNYLNNNYTIQGVSRKNSDDLITYDQVTNQVLNNVKAFIHLAGKAHDLKKTSEDKEYFKINTDLTVELFDKFLESDCEVFIYMSSVKAAADAVDGVLTESITPTPVTAYGKSKLEAENYILSKVIPENKRVYVLRPCMIHGPNNKGNLNVLFGFVAKGIPYPFGKYKNQRSFLSIDNLCFFINELIENPNIESGIYNVADDNSISTNQLVTLIGETIGKPARLWKVPKFLVFIIAKVGDLLPFPVNSEKLQKLTENYVVSNAKIKKEIKKELPLSAEKGIKKTIGSFL